MNYFLITIILLQFCATIQEWFRGNLWGGMMILLYGLANLSMMMVFTKMK